MAELKKIKIADIDFGDRVREDYGDLNNLLESIRENELITPIAVLDKKSLDNFDHYKTDTLNDEKPYLLLAGGRRTMAHVKGEIPEIEAKIFNSHKDALEIKRIELYENLDREDLNYKEEVKLKKEIHDLEVAIHGEMESVGPKKKGHSIRDTARILNQSPGGLSEDLKLAEAIEMIPEIGKQKTKTEAKKMLRQFTKELEDREKLDKIKKEREGQDSETVQKKVASRYINRDFLEGAKDIPDGSINFVELDPPLPLGFEDNMDRYDNVSYTPVTNDNYLDMMRKWLTEAYRIMSSNSWIVVWYPIEPWHGDLLALMQEVGFKTRGIPLMWNKVHGTGKSRSPNYNLGNGYEVAFYGRKGDTILNSPGHNNVYTFKPADKSKRFHPTEKPVELYQEIIETFCRKGSSIVIGFAGSGNAILAAENANMAPIGYDVSEDFKTKFDLKAYDDLPGSYTSYAK